MFFWYDFEVWTVNSFTKNDRDADYQQTFRGLIP